MTMTSRPELTSDQLQALDGYWRAANYLSVGQIYLMANPMLTEPLRPEHIKPRLLGHWGTTPGLNFLWSHLNRAIVTHGLNMMYVIGPGHGGPAAIANTWLDGSYSDIYPSIPRDLTGNGPAVPPVLVPGRGAQPRRPGDARLHPRGRRAGLFPVATRTAPRSTTPTSSWPAWSVTVRPRPGRWPPAGTPASSWTRPGRGGAADPAPERLEDRQPHGAGPDPGAGAHRPAARVRLPPGVRVAGSTTRPWCIGNWPAPWTTRSWRSVRCRRARRPPPAGTAPAGHAGR